MTIDHEQIQTTPEHPFYTASGHWVKAGELRPGDAIRKANGVSGTVQASTVVQRPQVMYNLTVAQAHTFFVGHEAWLVHNGGCKNTRDEYLGRTPGKNSRTGREVIERMTQEGTIREGEKGIEVYHPDAGWVDLSDTDMGHITDAVSWWNETGRSYGPKAPEVREWMLDSDNYSLEPYWINRSNGAKLTTNYLPPLEKK